MPVCKKCSHHWSWTETVKEIFTITKSMTCPSCKAIQYTSNKSRIVSYLMAIVVIVLILTVGTFLPSPFLPVFSSLLFVLLFLIYPFILSLSNEKPYF
ncbi:CXXC-20-CXXC protein [Alkalibacillus salilacus]|uniref:CXXC-20-CXXC protein n=2 Tax=Alkalibacillus salilacus TaxID=284582 RepID=A0ABT9VIH4_9BACI|nr:CXXC-20-CXXC protein [Alkalibacillus salilacus]